VAKRPNIADLQVWKNLAAATEEDDVRAYKEAKEIIRGKIRPNPDQPRKSFDPAELTELAESIQEHGLLQPILVRPEGDHFIIIAGERRWRAIETLGWDYVPCIIRDATQLETIEKSLIENLKRVGIPPVEEARCYRQLIDEYGYSIRPLAKKLNMSVGYIHSRLGLLEHEDLTERVEQGEVGVFEARELAKIKDEAQRREVTDMVAAKTLDRDALKQKIKWLTGSPETTATAPELDPPPTSETTSTTAPTNLAPTTAAKPSPEDQPISPVPVKAQTAKTSPPTLPQIQGEPSTQQLSSFNAERYVQRWHELHQELEHEMSRLESKEKVKVRQFLQDVQASINRILIED
jgi:ParB family chromosome partitioning protein